MSHSNSAKKRLIKNTFLLYGRTIIVMFVSLYVSRLILNILGVSDYGIYNAVGGMVGMLALVSNSLVAATQRYISFELGKKDGNPSRVFSLAMGLHIIISIFILLIAETIGLWFLNTNMNLPIERMVAANWVFQFSVLSFIIHLLTIPYYAIIVAQEKMNIFALFSIAEVLLKLGFAMLLLLAFTDKLIYYSISMALVPAFVFLFNYIYCRLIFKECCIYKYETKIIAYKQIGGFIGWNFIGSTATVLSKQGVNVLLNIFCGVIVNAGRGIATQVDNAINQFINSFTTAIRPQITKYFAAKEFKECFSLVNQGTKMIMYLTLFFVIPLTLRSEYVLTIWLKTVPDYAVLFTRLSFLVVTMDALSTPLYYLMLATGRIRNYQLAVSSITLLTFPLTWLALKMGFNPEITYYILFVTDIGRWIFQLVFLKKIASFDVSDYFKKAILPVSFVIIVPTILGLLINNSIENSFYGFVVVTFITSTALAVSVLVFGLSRNERAAVKLFIYSKIPLKDE